MIPSERITSILLPTIWMMSMTSCPVGRNSGRKKTCRSAVSTLFSWACASSCKVLARPEWLLLIDNRQHKIRDFVASRSTFSRQKRTQSGRNSAKKIETAQFRLLNIDSYFCNFNCGNGGNMLSFALESDSCCCHTNQRQLEQP